MAVRHIVTLCVGACALMRGCTSEWVPAVRVRKGWVRGNEKLCRSLAICFYRTKASNSPSLCRPCWQTWNFNRLLLGGVQPLLLQPQHHLPPPPSPPCLQLVLLPNPLQQLLPPLLLLLPLLPLRLLLPQRPLLPRRPLLPQRPLLPRRPLLPPP